MPEQEQADVRLAFARLKQDHADFEAAVAAMMQTGCDPLQISDSIITNLQNGDSRCN